MLPLNYDPDLELQTYFYFDTFNDYDSHTRRPWYLFLYGKHLVKFRILDLLSVMNSNCIVFFVPSQLIDTPCDMMAKDVIRVCPFLIYICVDFIAVAHDSN